ncbi:MAG: NUDIX hydrolase [Sphingobacteriaceae bacterium]|nr:NUDIX hydrolase [Cytophagaceae bacterium]
MHRVPLLDLLYDYTAADHTESDHHERFIRFVCDYPDCFERNLAIGHITGSAWITAPDQTQVLLLHHRKLDRWLQPGGHADGDPDVRRVAFREATEETGLLVTLARDGIFDLDIHEIPDNTRDAAHLHYDMRFHFTADPAQPLVVNSESKALVWVPMERVSKYTSEESVRRMVGKSYGFTR